MTSTTLICHVDPATGDVGTPITSFHMKSMCVENPSPSWNESHRDWNASDPVAPPPPTLDGFVASAANDARQIVPPMTDVNGIRAMGYYDGGDLNYYYFMASNFATSDRWFSPVLTRTPPNREYLVGGTSHGYVYPVGSNPNNQQLIPSPPIYELLDQASPPISWTIYVDPTATACSASSNGSCLFKYSYVQNFSYVQTILNKEPQNIAPLPQFFTDLQNGTLPEVVQIEPSSFAGLDEHPAAPRLVWVHLYDPHDPYEPPSPYAKIYKDRLYDGEIAYADSALDHFLAYLKKRGWYDGALIVVVGDHGEGLGEHHEDTHGIFLYDSTTHVPLILKLPNGQETGRVVDEQVRTTDILPTILELLGIPMPSRLDGASLMPLILGAKSASRPAFGETDYPLRFGWAPLRSVRQDGFKFIEAPRPEFYDLHSDAEELRNHYVPWDVTVQTLRKTLAEHTAKSPSVGKLSPSTVSSGTIDELHALGYLTAADAHSSTTVPEPSLLPDPKDKIEEQNLMHIATMASEAGRWAKARVALEKLLQLNDKSLMARLLLGHVCLGSNNPKAAEDQFEAAVLLQPGNLEAQLGLARALLGEKKFADAVDLLEETAKSGTKDPEAFELLAQAYTGLRKPVLAKKAADRANSIRDTRPQQ